MYFTFLEISKFCPFILGFIKIDSSTNTKTIFEWILLVVFFEQVIGVQGKNYFKWSLECLKKVRKINHIFHLFMIFLDSDKLRSVATLFIDDRLKIFFSNLLRTVSCIALILVKLDSFDFLHLFYCEKKDKIQGKII